MKKVLIISAIVAAVVGVATTALMFKGTLAMLDTLRVEGEDGGLGVI